MSFAELAIILLIGLAGLFATLVLIACIGWAHYERCEQERIEHIQAIAVRKRQRRAPSADLECAYRLPAREPERTRG